MEILKQWTYKPKDKSFDGNMTVVAHIINEKGPMFWSNKQITMVCHVSKETEMINIINLARDGIFLAQQLYIMLYISIQIKNQPWKEQHL